MTCACVLSVMKIESKRNSSSVLKTIKNFSALSKTDQNTETVNFLKSSDVFQMSMKMNSILKVRHCTGSVTKTLFIERRVPA